jgi:hypothetical protein
MISNFDQQTKPINLRTKALFLAIMESEVKGTIFQLLLLHKITDQ